ncbi:phage scaffolding protein [Acetobacter conturbans]|uniref:Phage minor structual protein GP20 n=1 Tax=Acetobacter conturbans TaxID=1737472 RepID=A0ABX0JZT9_9PROT|nr:phage scaffolding protein [Acetobacter conturbans]NHN88868.1 hypothetical protein [Acetobacter conturbans]
MELTSNSVRAQDERPATVNDAASTPRSAADSVADAFSGQLIQVQADLAEARAHAAAVEDELSRMRSEAAEISQKQAEQIAGIKKTAAIRTSAVASGLVDLDCLPLLDTSGIAFDENGDVTGVDDAFSDLKARKPFLFPGSQNGSKMNGTARPSPAPRAKANASMPVKDMSESEYRRSLKKVAPSYSRRYN